MSAARDASRRATVRVFSIALACLAAALGLPTAAAAHGPEDDHKHEKPGAGAAHFHHVRLNVTNPRKTVRFYAKHLGAVPVDYAGKSQALFTERSFILFNEVETAPPYMPHSAISHIGWASVDGQADYEWLKEQGVEFETHIGQLGNNYGMYFYGPDKELVELWTGGKNHRFDHVHLWATDVGEMVEWFTTHLGIAGQAGPQPAIQDRENILALRMGQIRCDNVGIVVFGRPEFDSIWWPGGSYTADDAPDEFQPTAGRAINHIAFSYRDIEPVFARMEEAGVEIVEPIAEREVGHKSFFVMAPDKILVEIVQAKPIPDASWE